MSVPVPAAAPLALPLGATAMQGGVWFALAAPQATAAQVCVYDETGTSLVGTWTAFQASSDSSHADTGPVTGIWRAWAPGVTAGMCYGWRVDGPWNPAQGQRFNPNKLLLDPYAREVVGRYDGSDIHVGHVPGQPHVQDPRNNAATAMKARVIQSSVFPTDAASGEHLPLQHVRVPAHRRVIYELHVRSFTRLHPAVPAHEQGTYLGMLHPAVIHHLQELGVTTICLMPLMFRADEARLQAMGLSNHWGYNPIAWMAPESRYATAPHRAVQECQRMIRGLHDAGFEVVLDVVFNHSAESDEHGPTLSLRGMGNDTYYRLLPNDPSRYENWAGCGNVLNTDHPLVQDLVIDSLRHWVQEYGVDGFRFDLAPVLARHGEQASYHPQPSSAPLLRRMAQDPVLSSCVMIAEPWDLGSNGYQLGQFDSNWMEWNDRFRDTQRATWLHQAGDLAALAQRISGSHDTFAGRPAHSSVNFVTAHDGFTLADLTAYEHRHNHANGEHNRDGHGHNLSCNHGHEGHSHDPHVLTQRWQARRVLATLNLLSLGTPMWLAGDEWGHSQQGNNNAYCQDNAITWIDWPNHHAQHFCDFVKKLIALRQEHEVFQASHWWQAQDIDARGVSAHWMRPSGEPMQVQHWHEQPMPAMALVLLARPSNKQAWWGLNPTAHEQSFVLPEGAWTVMIDSHYPEQTPRRVQGVAHLPARSVWVALSVSSHVQGSEEFA